MKLSVEAKARIAELWAAGAPAWQIREEAGVSRHAVLRQVRRLRRPLNREPVRSPLRLSLIEREEISRGLAAGESLRGIGRRLGRAPSTISREVNRNGGGQRDRAHDECGVAIEAVADESPGFPDYLKAGSGTVRASLVRCREVR